MARKARLGPLSFSGSISTTLTIRTKPPEPFKNQVSWGALRRRVAYTDSAVGKFLAYLHSKGLYDGTMISVMADHGSLWETMANGTRCLSIRFDHARAAGYQVASKSFRGKLVQTQAALVDVTPTILQTLGMPIPA